MKTFALALAATLATCGGAFAAPVDPLYSSFIVFGDSLSDDGNLFTSAGQPTAPYFDGRFSNGPVWAETVADRFAISENFAFGGAGAATDGDGVPDFGAQVSGYLASPLATVAGPRPLASVWFGANDLFAGIATGTVPEAIEMAMTAIASGVAALQAGGVSDFMLFELPDLGDTPLYNLIFPPASSGASAASAAFNVALSGLADGLADRGANVSLVRTSALFDDLLNDPMAYGLSEATLPCLFLNRNADVQAAATATAEALSQPLVCDADTAQERVFFDLVHPNAAVHAALAENVLTELETMSVSPVPVPASLPLALAALATFGLVRRRVAR
ncbi:SGNH/GDSL hydrolase family protein [uncultured Jannaschia sp.]|uniref:SGNH/GDSL hydrolase family protein n=1 Tax=uncultured Jannaschia sp. TaxID=293347 RepID=UPI00262E2731|nr:SGNH/GDSL hydrolase family protein [uncultured Jannaschia sp.]